jgi:L-threonylcarbamoyladenylate synthase
MIRIPVDDQSCIIKAINVLRAGGVIVYPTDTLYGFGVDAQNSGAVRHLNEIKKRSGPISIIAPNREAAIAWIDMPIPQDIDKYLGGAKTLIAPLHKGVVSDLILAQDGSAGIRIPHSGFCQKLAKRYKEPYTTTSVNLSGHKPLNNPDLIEKLFSPQIELIVDSGELPESKGSTIYKMIGDLIEIIR